jgi:large subunit ribosomal protein L24
MARIRKDDFVQVISGRDKGKTGKVLKVFPREEMCIVEKVGMVKRHQKAKQGGGPSGIVEKATKIHWSKVMPVDVKTKKPSRIKSLTKDGKKTRIYVVSGDAVDAA